MPQIKLLKVWWDAVSQHFVESKAGGVSQVYILSVVWNGILCYILACCAWCVSKCCLQTRSEIRLFKLALRA